MIDGRIYTLDTACCLVDLNNKMTPVKIKIHGNMHAQRTEGESD